MKFGLTKEEYSFLFKHLIKPLKEEGARVFIFGSRARGNYQKFSDIDILYKESKKIPDAKLYELITFFEDSDFSYKIDLVNDSSLAKSYLEGVKKEMIEVSEDILF